MFEKILFPKFRLVSTKFYQIPCATEERGHWGVSHMAPRGGGQGGHAFPVMTQAMDLCSATGHPSVPYV